MFSDQSRIKRRYPPLKNSMYSHRFFSDLASGYSFTFGKKGENRDFYQFNPNECQINTLLRGQYHYYSSHDIEQIIDRIAYSLMAYGKAYFYIHPEYSVNEADDGTKTQILESFEIEVIEGFIKRRTKEEITFCKKGLNDEIKELHMLKKQLVVFDIKELGLSRGFFSSILRKLSKCDITTDMITNPSNVYDYKYHSERKKLEELKILRKIGWSFGNEKLSDSYILYKKIQEDELKLRFLEYIVKKINDGLHGFLGDDSGELVAHVNRKDYGQLWDDYMEGRITGTELTSLLF